MKRTLLFILVFFTLINVEKIYSQNSDENRKHIDFLLEMKDDTNKVNELNNFLWKLQSDSANAIYCAQKSIQIAEKLGYVNGIATAQKNLAAYYFYSGMYDTAMSLYEKSLENYQKVNNKKGIAINYRNIGNIYNQKGNWKVALDYYIKSLQLREEIKDTAGVAAINNAIGLLYASLDNTNKQSTYQDSALRYFNRALIVFNQLKDKYNIASTCNNISSSYNNLFAIKGGDSHYIDSCKIYAYKALFLSSEINDPRLQATSCELLGENYMQRNQDDSAIFYFNKGLELSNQINNLANVANLESRIGYYYFNKNDYINAEKHYNIANKICSETNSKPLLKDVKYILSSIYYKTGRYNLAYEYLLSSDKLKDSLMNDDEIKQLTKLSMQYEFDKKQKIEAIEQQKKDAIQQAEIKRQRIVTFFALGGLALMMILAFVIFRSYQQKKRNNFILQEKNEQISIQNELLHQQTEEIKVQNEILFQQTEEIKAQNEEITKAKQILEAINKEITESITYARRIQQAVLTTNTFFEKNLREYFIFYRPRNIVSGDFFWASRIDNHIIITAVDCTRHGVPGAFMSMLGISFLNQIVNQELRATKDFDAAKILNKMRDLVISTLGHQEGDDNPQDGMDMSLVIIDSDTKKVNYAGAYNPLYICRNDELIIIKADKMPVGYHFMKQKTPFSNEFFDYKTNDKFYIFSDGFADQFGGKDGKKYSPAQMRQIFIENNKLPMSQQGELIKQSMENWMNSGQNPYKQTDDMLVIGFIVE